MHIDKPSHHPPPKIRRMLVPRPVETKSVSVPPVPSALTIPEPWGPVLPVAAHLRCRVVRQLTAEMVMLVGERVPLRRDRRRTSCHVRQISMYVCHVVLQISLTDIGHAFGRDRTTVSHACNVVEDRRDDTAFDEFVSSVERVITSVFGAPGGREHE
ncbi:MAG TPA: helix-turn-helix domain-containing protein [Pararhizobium sp.]|uniref:helix-turn-helix domain-containing protein n=1 Tax=Pararhizobium sp. TaxID=1977563 RepID=UPI002D0E0BEB|nr:helix-turn-helix domain-containing protein [Pararhizobium sp.]HTO30862.1 helix-turn-helix domain-containing protein [Pararhizobium sp.]